MRSAHTAVLIAASALALSLTLQDGVAPPPRGIDLEAFGGFGPEQRWVSYRRSVRAHGESVDTWVRFLEARKDFELLEQLAIYEGFQQIFKKGKPGEVLYRHDAPQWMRVALWNLKQRDTHNAQAATSPLEQNANRFVGWAEKYKDVERLGGAALLKKYRERAPEDPGNQLPPLDPHTVILPYLDAPKSLPKLAAGDRIRPFEPNRRYAFQTLRAIRAISIAGVFREPYRTKLLRLTRHPHDEVRRTALLEFSEFPSHQLPWKELLAMSRDQTLQNEDRRIALLSASYSDHPAVYLYLHEVLREPEHPGFAAVISRLNAIGDGYTVEVLNQLPLADRPKTLRTTIAAALRVLRQAAAQRAAKKTGAPLGDVLYRAAFATAADDPQAETLLAWTRRHIAHRIRKPGELKTLRKIQADPEKTSIPREVRDWVRREATRILGESSKDKGSSTKGSSGKGSSTKRRR